MSLPTEEAVRKLRGDPAYADLITDAYLDLDVNQAAERFLASGEFAEVRNLLSGRLEGGRVLDIGAGTGIASYAFAKSGARAVLALEPDPSDEIGRGAIARIATGLPIEVLRGYGEDLPLPDESVDVVYARQVLHHATDLARLVAECARVLTPEGVLLACREHVVDDERQLREFLTGHPVHALAGGEGAHRLDAYLGALRAAGLVVERVLGPWDSVINAFPAVRDRDELRRYPRMLLEEHLGSLGGLLARIPGVTALAWRRVRRPTPGRMYSFVASKPRRPPS